MNPGPTSMSNLRSPVARGAKRRCANGMATPDSPAKTIGLIGGMSWESTLEYYRLINQAWKEELGGLHSAKCILYSVDFAEIADLQRAEEWREAARLLAHAARSVERAGADMVLLCTNTMHKVAGSIQKGIGIPLLHIADATARKIDHAGFRRVGLLGTRFTMEDGFYSARLADRFGLQVLVPNKKDRHALHRIIFDELCLGKVRSDSRVRMAAIMSQLASRGAQAIILGCTELGLLVRDGDSPVPLFDTTREHARAAVEAALGTGEAIDAQRSSESERTKVSLGPRQAAALQVREQIDEREALFLRFGYDSAASLNFILEKALPLPGHVLEVGTGKGRFLSLLASHTERITTVDHDADQQRVARLYVCSTGRWRHIRYLAHDAEKLPWANASFDSVISVNTFHHLERPYAVLQEMLRLLKPGGKLILADFSPRGFRIFDRIHRAEGRTHPRLKNGLAEFETFLRGGTGTNVRRYRGCNQEILAVQAQRDLENAGPVAPVHAKPKYPSS